MFYDVIVIGAGLAGFMAAEAAQSQGARVLILARGMGSLPLTSGCIDGLGYSPSNSRVPLSSPLSGLEHLRESHGGHPYVKIKQEIIIQALRRFQEIVHQRGLPYVGSFDSNFLIPTPLGTFHPTCLVPVTMSTGDLSTPGSALLLGIRGLKDFSPFLAAENLNLMHSRGRIASSFRAELLERFHLPGKSMNALNLASAFDGKDFRDTFAQKVKPLLKPKEKLGLPAVLGFHSAKDSWVALQEKLGVEIFEIPMPPPSIPGIRLDNMLRVHLKEKGVRILTGLSSLKPLIEGGKIVGLMMGERRNPHYRAQAFVLATGKFIGGGLDSDQSRICETLLDLPIRYPKLRSEWFNQNLLTLYGQPFNGFGLEVNESLQPVDFEGQVIYSNLFAAGGIIAHADSMTEKSGGGVAIATGFQAGLLAAEVK
jgi:glycerol-3-phosphate dehydrogenase subunit B